MGVKTPIYLFSDTPHEGVEHLPLLEIAYLSPSIDLLPYDALIFTSKKAVMALELMGVAWHEKASYAIGEGTAQAILEAKGHLAFTCKLSYGDHFAQTLIPLLQGKKVFFPRAKEVVSPLFETLTLSGIAITQCVVYETHCKHYPPEQKPPQGSVLIFTSPSTIRCFERNFGGLEGYEIVAIGDKSAHVLPPTLACHIPQKQSIEASIALGYALYKQSRSKNLL